MDQSFWVCPGGNQGALKFALIPLCSAIRFWKGNTNIPGQFGNENLKYQIPACMFTVKIWMTKPGQHSFLAQTNSDNEASKAT